MKLRGDSAAAGGRDDILESTSGTQCLAEPVQTQRPPAVRRDGEIDRERVMNRRGPNLVSGEIRVGNQRTAGGGECRFGQNVGLDALRQRVRECAVVAGLLRSVKVLEVEAEPYAEPLRGARDRCQRSRRT